MNDKLNYAKQAFLAMSREKSLGIQDYKAKYGTPSSTADGLLKYIEANPDSNISHNLLLSKGQRSIFQTILADRNLKDANRLTLWCRALKAYEKTPEEIFRFMFDKTNANNIPIFNEFFSASILEATLNEIYNPKVKNYLENTVQF